MHINGTANYRVGFMFFEVFPGGGVKNWKSKFVKTTIYRDGFMMFWIYVKQIIVTVLWFSQCSVLQIIVTFLVVGDQGRGPKGPRLIPFQIKKQVEKQKTSKNIQGYSCILLMSIVDLTLWDRKSASKTALVLWTRMTRMTSLKYWRNNTTLWITSYYLDNNNIANISSITSRCVFFWLHISQKEVSILLLVLSAYDAYITL